MCGFAEQLEWIDTFATGELDPFGGKTAIESFMLKAARATCDFYMTNTPVDGIPYWDTGAPGLQHLDNYLQRTSDPFNDYEPIDSSAAAIGAQGLLRLGKYLQNKGDADNGQR